jgi:hypothetical protein
LGASTITYSTAIDRLLHVYTVPDESQSFDIDVRLVAPIPKDALSQMGHVSSMRLLVEGPIEKMEQDVRNELQSRLLQSLESRGINVELLHRCTQLSITYEELSEIEQSRNHLRLLLSDLKIEFTDMIAKLRHEIQERFSTFAANPDHLGQVFPPTHEQTIDSFLDLPLEQLIGHRLEHYISFCSAALAMADELKLQILDGTQKKKITEWWLRLIHKRQDMFLSTLGYDFTAVPRNYIETPPESIEAVQNNLRIVREILNVKQDIHNAQQLLVEQLKNEIYPKIDEYIRNAQCAVADALGESTTDRLPLPYATKLFQSRARKMQPSEANRIESLLKDVEYLQKIQEMENPEAQAAQQARGLDVVPISGLVMSGIHRMENVLKTVLEVWAGRLGAATTSPVRIGSPPSATTVVSPRATTASPPGTVVSPRATAASPPGTVVSPRATAASPPGTVVSPRATTASPPGTVVSPRATAASPPVAVVSPRATAASPPVAVVSPRATAASSPIAVVGALATSPSLSSPTSTSPSSPSPPHGRGSLVMSSPMPIPAAPRAGECSSLVDLASPTNQVWTSIGARNRSNRSTLLLSGGARVRTPEIEDPIVSPRSPEWVIVSPRTHTHRHSIAVTTTTATTTTATTTAGHMSTPITSATVDAIIDVTPAMIVEQQHAAQRNDMP